MTGLLGAVGVELLVVEDPEQTAKIGKRWERRTAYSIPQPAYTIRTAHPIVLERLARRAAKARWADTTPEERYAFVATLNKARAAKRKPAPARMTKAA